MMLVYGLYKVGEDDMNGQYDYVWMTPAAAHETIHENDLQEAFDAFQDESKALFSAALGMS